jgi:superfamily II DNA or RNA helicase
MKLRQWQADCVDLALHRFSTGQKHFFVLATPGAGKTVMAATVAKELFSKNQIDYVVCFAPSLSVLEGMRATFSTILNRSMHGQLGAAGGVFSYQYLASSKSADWSFLENNRVLVVFDEIHHCAGDEPEVANAWGREILLNIAKHATLILSMSGTPWRSDSTKISLAKYLEPENTIHCDYSYGISEAIKDGVCRRPMVSLIDNDQLKVDEITYGSLGSAIKHSELRYSEVLKSEEAIRYLIATAVKQLVIARLEQKNAAGLVVASSVEEAVRIQQLLILEFRQSSIMVSYKDPIAHKRINEFRSSCTQWIISIGMVSEGTDIPRLRVCAHLSLIRTELFFRQVLGRILRLIPGISNDRGWLFSFAEPSLVEFAERLQQDIPGNILKIEKVPDLIKPDANDKGKNSKTSASENAPNNLDADYWICLEPENMKENSGTGNHQLIFRLQGQYKQQVFSIF